MLFWFLSPSYKRTTSSIPESATKRTPSIVTEVSAILVEMMHFLTPGGAISNTWKHDDMRIKTDKLYPSRWSHSNIICPLEIQTKLTVPYPAGPVRGCCAGVRLSSDVCVWHKSDRPPGWWRFPPRHWGRGAGRHAPLEGNADRCPVGCAGMVWDQVSLNGKPAPQVEWAGISPGYRKQKKIGC